MCGNLPAGLSACLRASFKDRPGFEEITMLGAPPLPETTAGGRPVTNNRYAIDNVHRRQYSINCNTVHRKNNANSTYGKLVSVQRMKKYDQYMHAVRFVFDVQ